MKCEATRAVLTLCPLNDTFSSHEAGPFLCCSLVPVAASPPPRGAPSSRGVPLLVYHALLKVSSRCFGASARGWHACAPLQNVGHLKQSVELGGDRLAVSDDCERGKDRRVRGWMRPKEAYSRRRRGRGSKNGLERVPQVSDVEVRGRELR
jgi:hypothetical protein